MFHIYILNDEPLGREQSLLIRDFFGQLVKNCAQTNFIIQEYVYPTLYEEGNGIETFQKMLQFVGSTYKIEPINERNWDYLAQEG